MKTYKIEVGGYVTVYREELIIVSGESEEEAKEQAINEFVKIQNDSEYSAICEEGNAMSIALMD